MSYFGIPRGRRKAFAQVRLLTDSGGVTKLYRDNDAGSVFTVTIGTWQEIVSAAQNTANTNMIETFDSTGETKIIGTGAGAAEVLLTYIAPGGSGAVPIRVDSATRIAIYYIVAPPANSETTINFYD